MKKNLLMTFALILGIVVITSSSKGQTSTKKQKLKKSEASFVIEDDSIIIRKMPHAKAPHAPKMNRRMVIVTPDDAEIPGIPQMPEMPFIFENKEFVFSTEGSGQKPQMFVFNNGDKNWSITMTKPRAEELNKIDKDYSEADQIQMLPDVMNNKLNLAYSFSASGMVQINLYDSESNLVRTDENKNYDGKKAQVSYDLTNIKDGIYYVEFKHDNGKIIKKLNIKR